jgi:hypothetical protein
MSVMPVILIDLIFMLQIAIGKLQKKIEGSSGSRSSSVAKRRI